VATLGISINRRVGVGMLAGLFLLIGRNKMNLASLRPDKTIQSLEENVTWLKKRKE
jgi:hypothetical protein